MTVAAENGLDLPESFYGSQFRAAQIEDIDEGNGTIRILAAPYDVETMLGERLFESFAPGSLSRGAAAPHRVKIYGPNHGGPLVGAATSIEDANGGVVVEARFASTVAAQEARSLVRDQILEAASVEFRPQRQHMSVERRADGVHVRHSRAVLTAVALVADLPAYDDARVLSVRSVDEAAREALEAARQARIDALRDDARWFARNR